MSNFNEKLNSAIIVLKTMALPSSGLSRVEREAISVIYDFLKNYDPEENIVNDDKIGEFEILCKHPACIDCPNKDISYSTLYDLAGNNSMVNIFCSHKNICHYAKNN